MTGTEEGFVVATPSVTGKQEHRRKWQSALDDVAFKHLISSFSAVPDASITRDHQVLDSLTG